MLGAALCIHGQDVRNTLCWLSCEVLQPVTVYVCMPDKHSDVLNFTSVGNYSTENSAYHNVAERDAVSGGKKI